MKRIFLNLCKVVVIGFLLILFLGLTILFFGESNKNPIILMIFAIYLLVTGAFFIRVFDLDIKISSLFILRKIPSSFLFLCAFIMPFFFMNALAQNSTTTKKESISSDIVKEDKISNYTNKSEENNNKEDNEKRKQEIKIELNEKLKGLPFEQDDVEGTTYILNSYLENYTNTYQFYPYLATNTNINNENFLDNFDLNLLLRISYEGQDWLFVDSMTIKTDNDKYELNMSLDKRDNSGGSVWEWRQLQNREIDINMLEDMMNSNSVTIRLKGRQYYDDRELTYNEKEALKQIIPIYNLYSELKSLN